MLRFTTFQVVDLYPCLLNRNTGNNFLLCLWLWQQCLEHYCIWICMYWEFRVQFLSCSSVYLI